MYGRLPNSQSAACSASSAVTSEPMQRLLVALILCSGMLVACETPAARAERQRAKFRLSRVERALAETPLRRASQADVRAFLSRLDVQCEPNPPADEMIAYLGEWQGPLFRRGLHLVFYFDQDGVLMRYEAKEVEGS